MSSGAAADVDLAKLSAKHTTPLVLFPNSQGACVRIEGEVIFGRQ